MAIDIDRAALHALLDEIPDERLADAKAPSNCWWMLRHRGFLTSPRTTSPSPPTILKRSQGGMRHTCAASSLLTMSSSESWACFEPTALLGRPRPERTP